MPRCILYVVVANVVDQEQGDIVHFNGLNVANISDQQYGYIVSHTNYGRRNYQSNRNWSLTLTGLQSNSVNLTFERLNTQITEGGECIDYLSITSLHHICGYTLPDPIIVKTHSNQLNINFVTADDFRKTAAGYTGFFIAYKGTV